MTMHRTMLADESRKRYPIDTKENTEASINQFMKEASARAEDYADNNILNRLVSAAEYHGLDIPTYKEASAEREKIVFDMPDGSISMAKIATVDDLHEAVAFILDKRNDFSRKDLSKVAAYIVQAADALDVNIDYGSMPKVARIAGIGVGDRQEIEEEFTKRATLGILDKAGAKEFWDYAAELKGMSDDDFFKSANLERVCATLEEVDALYKNAYRYGKDLEAPEDVVFRHNLTDLEKQAADFMLIPSIDITISKNELLKRAGAVNSFFSEHFNNVEKLEGEKLLEKVAGMDKYTAEALFSILDN